METIYCERASEISKEKAELERKLNVKIQIVGRRVTITGNALEEYEAALVFEAINFGYSVSTALLLKDEDMMFEKLNLKDFTRRKDLSVIKARLIGTQGRTKRTIENIADCKIIVRDKEIGILGAAEEVEYTITAIKNLIRGSKQSNVYKFLERINTQRKKMQEK